MGLPCRCIGGLWHGLIGSGICLSLGEGRADEHSLCRKEGRMSAATVTGGGGTVDPVLLEVIAGSVASIEKEVETAIARTSRSPMIRDAHDFRAGIHDRLLRKLTGRSYSSLVHPIVRDFPMVSMRPGDVFFHNDGYLAEGGVGQLPDLCVTGP